MESHRFLALTCLGMLVLLVAGDAPPPATPASEPTPPRERTAVDRSQPSLPVSSSTVAALRDGASDTVETEDEGDRRAEPFAGMTFPVVGADSLLRLSDYAGKVVLLNWGRSDCGWTDRQTPRLAELYERYRHRGLRIVGIMDENGTSISELPAFVERPEITWPLALMDQGEYAREILPEGTGRTPETFLLTRRGELQYVGLFRGEEYWSELESAVQEALAEPVPETPSIVPRPAPEAPSFQLPDLEGNTVSLEDFAGRPLVVHFFTDGSCDWAGELVGDLHRRHAEEVAFVGIGYGREASLRDCVDGQNLDFPVLVGDRETQRAWERRDVWAVYFITPEGRIVKEISRSLTNGIEDVIFPRYVDLLASGAWDRTAS